MIKVSNVNTLIVNNENITKTLAYSVNIYKTITKYSTHYINETQ